jgi:hypothetical protein
LSDPIWVEERIVHFLHSSAIERHGGPAGMLNANSLASALLRPQNAYHYNNPKPDIIELAAISSATTKARGLDDAGSVLAHKMQPGTRYREGGQRSTSRHRRLGDGHRIDGLGYMPGISHSEVSRTRRKTKIARSGRAAEG